MSDLFVDRLGDIVIADEVARLDFLRLGGLDAERKQARLATSVRLANSLSGRPQAIGILDKIRDEVLRQAQAVRSLYPLIQNGPPAFPTLDPKLLTQVRS